MDTSARALNLIFESNEKSPDQCPAAVCVDIAAAFPSARRQLLLAMLHAIHFDSGMIDAWEGLFCNNVIKAYSAAINPRRSKGLVRASSTTANHMSEGLFSFPSS